eukprot:Skav220704  [mRNA]  locus=scaffold472:888730:890025:+ [translate_table: standard]
MLLHDQCRAVTLDEDTSLLSKSAFLNKADGQADELWWSLNYVYDRFKREGDEKRKLFKCIQYLKQKVAKTEFCSGFWCQTRQIGLPQTALHENVAKTSGILAFFYCLMKESRTAKTVTLVKHWIAPLCSRVCSTQTHSVSIDIEDMQPLVLSPAGLIRGIENSLSSKHRACFFAWQKEWQSMCDAGELSDPLVTDADSAVSLQELVLFLFLVERNRRSANGHVWPKDSPSGTALVRFQEAIINFMARGIDLYVKNEYMQHHDVERPAPARRINSGACDDGVPDGQVVPGPSTRVHMATDAIYELLSQARETGVSMKQALKLLQDKRISSVAGCKPTAVDPWIRRSQRIYDQRCSLSLLGVTHFNLVADASVHAGKECLVSICYSHQANSACFANLQMIMPLTEIAPGEMELTSLLEQLAQDRPFGDSDSFS